MSVAPDPPAIQPHGVLLVLREPELVVTQASDNLAAHLQLGATDLLGQPLTRLFDPHSVDLVRKALADGRWEIVNPLRLQAGGKHFDGILHRHGGAAILELEPSSLPASAESVHHPLRASLIALQFAPTLAALRSTVVEELQRLTGFERVMLYRFDDEGHCVVDAEAKDPALEPYLGLRYPASDIPQQARDLYLKNWLRIIPDARATPVPVVPPARAATESPLDLSLAVLRSVAPPYLEYMANMGFRASLTISLIVRRRLWGLVICANHSGPLAVPYEIRSASEVLGRLASLQIAALEGRAAAELRASRRATRDMLAEALRTGEGLESLLTRPGELLSLVGAVGAAVVCSDRQQSCGEAPAPEIVATLSNWLEEQVGLVPFATAALPALFPAAAVAKETASGVLTFALPGAARRRVLWFRPEVPNTVHWGGGPNVPLATDPPLPSHTRKSFDRWKEEVRLQSAPWTAGDIEAAEDLRRYALEVDLERQVLREQRAVRARDDLVAVVSHDLRNPLGVIQMQATILLRTVGPSDHEFSRRLRSSAEHIQRSVDRMNTLIRDLLDLAKLEAGRFTLQRQPQQMGEMVDEALLILRPLADARRIQLQAGLHEARVSADRDRIFQVLSNLVGNAIKFTPPGGRVSLSCATRGAEVWVTVADTGPGIPANMLANVFDRYWQARSGDQQGAGLGLFIAKGIVEAHGGRIWAEAHADCGATFTFTLPLS